MNFHFITLHDSNLHKYYNFLQTSHTHWARIKCKYCLQIIIVLFPFRSSSGERVWVDGKVLMECVHVLINIFLTWRNIERFLCNEALYYVIHYVITCIDGSFLRKKLLWVASKEVFLVLKCIQLNSASFS